MGQHFVFDEGINFPLRRALILLSVQALSTLCLRGDMQKETTETQRKQSSHGEVLKFEHGLICAQACESASLDENWDHVSRHKHTRPASGGTLVPQFPHLSVVAVLLALLIFDSLLLASAAAAPSPGRYVSMRVLVTICFLLISTHSLAALQQKRATLTRAQTSEAERRLSELGYWTGPVDGRFDEGTKSALIAFQKWEGRAITAKLTLDELEAIRNGVAPQARDLGYAHVEVDVDRQVLMLINEEGVVRVLPVSTGNDKHFMDQGQMSVAYTPRGRFVVYDKTYGWENGDLGSIYYANYISGGVAIHGYLTVPTTPASHGCIRIPMFAAREVSRLLPVGTIVLVYDKVSFVSAKEWVKNPKLKDAALANGALQ
jgi:hypothetical protein